MDACILSLIACEKKRENRISQLLAHSLSHSLILSNSLFYEDAFNTNWLHKWVDVRHMWLSILSSFQPLCWLPPSMTCMQPKPNTNPSLALWRPSIVCVLSVHFFLMPCQQYYPCRRHGYTETHQRICQITKLLTHSITTQFLSSSLNYNEVSSGIFVEQ